MAYEMKEKQDKPRPPKPKKPAGEAERPFDTRELERLPTATEKDPPYRSWWVVESP